MSSISFPSEHPPSQESSANEGHFYPTFDASSSFQMNPLSSHPPRTPRVSMMSSSQHYGSGSIYEVKEETNRQIDGGEEELDEDEDGDKGKEAETRTRKEDIWREMFLTSYGRDKALKLIQYSLRVYLTFHLSFTGSRLLRRPTRPPWELEFVKRLQSTASGLSFTRKVLIMFNWLGPLTAIRAQQSVPFSAERSTEVSKKTERPFLQTLLYAPPPVLLDLVNCIADDVATLSKLGLLGRKVGERADRFSDWCWLLATLVGLVENGVERQMIVTLRQEIESRLYSESMSGATAKSKPKDTKIDDKELSRLQKQDYWLQITRAKLAMDLIYVSYDLFRIQRAREPVKSFTGLTAAILSCAKVYYRHKNTLITKLNETH